MPLSDDWTFPEGLTGVLLATIFLSPLSCSFKTEGKWVPISELLIRREYTLSGLERRVQISSSRRKRLLSWIKGGKAYIDSLSIDEYGEAPGDFSIKFAFKKDDKIVVRLFAPFEEEHPLFAGIQLICILDQKSFLPESVYMTALPWER